MTLNTTVRVIHVEHCRRLDRQAALRRLIAARRIQRATTPGT